MKPLHHKFGDCPVDFLHLLLGYFRPLSQGERCPCGNLKGRNKSITTYNLFSLLLVAYSAQQLIPPTPPLDIE